MPFPAKSLFVSRFRLGELKIAELCHITSDFLSAGGIADVD